MTTATRRRGIAAAAALTVLVLAGACSAGGDSADDGDSGGGSDAAPAAVADAPSEAADGGALADSSTASKADRQAYDVAAADSMAVEEAAAAQEPAEAADEQKLISNGQVRLKSDDVARSIFDVRNVVDKYAGEVEANNTETDDEGDPLRARLSVRVPTAQFDQAMQDLEEVGVLIASSGNTKDVTTEVLDRDIRVQVQRRSIQRISLLLDRAVTIRDVVAIEAQLSQRQADLAVLEKEQRYLDDQTAMATINVALERTKEKRKAPPAVEKDDDDGFFAGLSSGWSGLKTFGTGLATVLGALLPWLVVAGVLAVPGFPLYRRLRRRPSGAGQPA